MNTKFATLTLAALLSVAGTTSALAHQDYGEGTMYHNLEHVTSTTSQTTQRAPAPFGYAVGGSQARRIVTIDSSTRYLNVTRGEVVQINIAGKSITWIFDTLGTPTFSLDKIIPGAGHVTVYVASNISDNGG